MACGLENDSQHNHEAGDEQATATAKMVTYYVGRDSSNKFANIDDTSGQGLDAWRQNISPCWRIVVSVCLDEWLHGENT